MSRWGKFTAKGSGAVDDLIAGMMDTIVAALKEVVSENDYVSLVMIGGYGRSEGGVVVENGIEKPHNNFDFVLITNDLPGDKLNKLKHDIDNRMGSVIDEIGVGIDFGLVNASRMKSSSCLVMWYDMRYGHKTILGDESFVPSLSQFNLDNIPAWDVRNLLVNRGTLLVINDLLLESESPEVEFKKIVIKHAVKAIIGYGDTFLYFHGKYDWSYLEKQKRMSDNTEVDPDFKKLYNEAMEFRFRPDYETYLKKDLKAWMEELRISFNKLHLLTEQRRIGIDDLNWDTYTDFAFKHSLKDDLFSFKSMAKKCVNFLKGSSYPGPAPIFAKIGFRCSGMRGILPTLFPLVIYDLGNERFKDLVSQTLDSKSPDIEDLRRSYLKKWSSAGDTNFYNMLKQYSISLDSRDGGTK